MEQARQGMGPTIGMTEDELQSLAILQEVCNEHEGLNMKLNWMRLNQRTGDQASDFLWFEDGRLVGFLGLYQFVPTVIELSGLVHPGYRRRGIFSQLFAAARRECIRRGVGEMLLICERTSPGAAPFALSVGGEYRFSEFKMEWQGASGDAGAGPTLTLREAGPESAHEIARQNHIFFDIPMPADDELDLLDLSTPGRKTYFALVDGAVVGKVHLHVQGGEGWIAGLGVLPEYRRRGYGRAMLRQAVARLVEMQPETIALEVETRNDGALTLYQSCGFDVVTGYEYYAVATASAD
jgi:ribosomal protein S18 acetylase RimI-like enzyme